MSGADFIALLPLLILAGTAVAVVLGVAIRRSHPATAVLTIAGLAAAFASSGPPRRSRPDMSPPC